MFIKSLNIKSFRNIKTLKINFSEGINLLIGDNAQGKTNLLEAIYYLSTGRSFRTKRDNECISWENPDAVSFFEGEICKNLCLIKISTAISKTTKQVQMNSKKIGRLADLIGNLRAVLFLPTDLNLIKGSPSHRRDYLDMEISQIDNSYLANLQDYQEVLKQRNMLLKKISKSLAKESHLEIWDKQFIELAWKITKKRSDFLNNIEPIVASLLKNISEDAEKVEIKYAHSAGVKKNLQEDIFKPDLANILKKQLSENIRYNNTTSGPHRDDFSVNINTHNLKMYGSQGQQRSCVLALKLAEVQLMKQLTGEYPILLLDDVLSELDEHRQNHLFDNIPDNVQAIMTSTDTCNLNFSNRNNVKIFNVKNGNFNTFNNI